MIKKRTTKPSPKKHIAGKDAAAERHMNAFLIVPEIVYNLSTKLQKGVLHDHLGQKQEINLINFITRFGYATQRGPYLNIHGAYTQYTTLNPTKYIQGCVDNVN